MSRPIFHILTGEYPPRQGGVSDYTAQVSVGLAQSGADVHVWTTSTGDKRSVAAGVTVHSSSEGWSQADLKQLGEELDAFPKPRTLLVQYTPFAWGYRGLNFGFCRWLVERRRTSGDEIRLMIHEVAYPWVFRDRPTRWLLAAGQRWMARTVLKAATHVDVSTPAWEPMLKSLSPGNTHAIAWRPVPSNIPVIDDAEAVARARSDAARGAGVVIGCFGGFTELVGPLLAKLLKEALRGREDRVVLLIGRGGDRFAAEQGTFGEQMVATGAQTPAEVSIQLQACDLIVQPYPDGITTRRTSAMAALAHGIPLVTNAGHLTEAFWRESGAVALAKGIEEMAGVVNRLSGDPIERAKIGAAGQALYESRFALARTIEALIGESA